MLPLLAGHVARCISLHVRKTSWSEVEVLVHDRFLRRLVLLLLHAVRLKRLLQLLQHCLQAGLRARLRTRLRSGDVGVLVIGG